MRGRSERDVLMSINPIAPEEVQVNATKPDEVIEIFNDLIKQNWNGENSKVLQTDAVDMIANKLNISRDAVFKAKHLDIEYIYERAGWVVEYDKPGFNENPYPPFFIFSKPNKR